MGKKRTKLILTFEVITESGQEPVTGSMLVAWLDEHVNTILKEEGTLRDYVEIDRIQNIEK